MSIEVKILPSLLAADFGRLAEEARRAETAGGDELHIDIMDGHFVPNLSMGPEVVAMAKRTVRIPLSVHLMITNPGSMAGQFAREGASAIFVHLEMDVDVPSLLRQVRSLGVRPGIVLNPETPAERAFPILGLADEVLCMTVHPGAGGQIFIRDVLPKIRQVRDRLSAMGSHADILVDGGINAETAAECAAQGANAFVAGTFLFKAADMTSEVSLLRRRAQAALK